MALRGLCGRGVCSGHLHRRRRLAPQHTARPLERAHADRALDHLQDQPAPPPRVGERLVVPRVLASLRRRRAAGHVPLCEGARRPQPAPRLPLLRAARALDGCLLQAGRRVQLRPRHVGVALLARLPLRCAARLHAVLRRLLRAADAAAPLRGHAAGGAAPLPLLADRRAVCARPHLPGAADGVAGRRPADLRGGDYAALHHRPAAAAHRDDRRRLLHGRLPLPPRRPRRHRR
mmetsp:Transcript_14217/g.42104  ORF Transcript_14217/g.42104 Transcript_14217/m.42104 type:complete len:233 (+) Transcript_14217:355-1053(+)